MKEAYMLAVDQGTSSTKSIIFDYAGKVIAKGSVPLKTHYLDGGFVEQEPEAIYQNVIDSVAECLDAFTAQGYSSTSVVVGGISNQRETFVVWDETGMPLYNAVVWQCKRSVAICERLEAEPGLSEIVNSKTGLIIDPYFSATKLIWLNENNEKVRTAIEAGKAYFGTVDTWLLYRFTNGQQYVTDHTNASRTLFFNLQELSWDEELLERFGLSKLNLPAILTSSADYGKTDFNGVFPELISIGSMIGDSHAAAFGEGCFSAGSAKATMGTGCSVLMNIGGKPYKSSTGMMTTVCWSIPGRVDLALEGVIVTCGATIEWLKNELGIFSEIKEVESMATSIADNEGVYLIPAFSGLGAPHWQMSRKAMISGLTLSSNKNHVVRAALESIAYQLKDVTLAMAADTHLKLTELMVNGGITSNRFVQQFAADLLNCQLKNRGITDVSALGAALLAGLQAGVYTSIEEIKSLQETSVTYNPNPERDLDAYYQQWCELLKQF